ncbi:kinase-like domain-containing protein [Lipomyces kononenkoae]|uniref:Kinase-like domain-containing protein n=1 Tax=Lipomyces kononenkoae TaxID=34357 RepID=A0ACC3SX54_LIPKO
MSSSAAPEENPITGVATVPSPIPDLMTITNKPINVSLYKGFLGSSTSINQFDKLNRLGEGTYGVVYRARDRRTNEIVALKAVRIFANEKRDGIPNTALREISLLKSLRHENIIRVLEVAVGETQLDEVYMVLEYAEHDLADLIDYSNARFSASEVKCLMKQLLEGLEYIHKRGIIHRDIKMSNLLLTARGILKIADFGLARSHTDRPMTPGVVTIWYRCPELLFGTKNYTSAIDLWSTGCIMGELVCRKPLLPGESEKQQIDLIVDLLGAPNERIWPGFRTLPLARNFRLHDLRPNTLDRVLRGQSRATIEFVNDLLTYDPDKRITAKAALQHQYFEERPKAMDPGLLPTFPEVRSFSNTNNRHGSKTRDDKSDDSEGDEPSMPRHGDKWKPKGTYAFEIDENELLLPLNDREEERRNRKRTKR